jgi:hypothetical protein
VKRVAESIAKRVKIEPVAAKVTKAISKTADVDVNGKKVKKTVEHIVEDVVENTAVDAAKEAVKAVADAG